jgi:hypothetical protein
MYKNFFFFIKPTDSLTSQTYFVKKLYIFRAGFMPIIRNFPLYIRHWYISSKLHDIPVPNVQWKTPDDGQRKGSKLVVFLVKINLGN